jgi:hypothetical protein
MPFNSSKVAPPAFSDPMVEESRFPTSEFYTWILLTLLPAIEQVPAVAGGTVPILELTGQNAAYALTPLPLGSLNAGVYRVSVYLRVTTPDGAASSVQPYVSFLDDGVTCTITGAALTSDAITVPVGQDFIMTVDQPGPISFGTNYASTTPGQMIYKATVTVERVQ